MQITVCDNCHKEIGDSTCVLDGWNLVVGGSTQHSMGRKEFCSLGCQQEYLLKGIRERGLEEYIKV